ncbi:hypothetical protein [Novosphingobium sp. M1R2S20]|uniref:Secreted protein with PEP-CTERM sorting signal n=1 Tax=Novosphingobium rhizovicinum TaxID=3228928 RepID=A0ABV3RAR1_9SPHN
MAILSQLFWGVTVGALSGTFVAIAKLLSLGGVLVGGGYAFRNRSKLRALIRLRR